MTAATLYNPPSDRPRSVISSGLIIEQTVASDISQARIKAHQRLHYFFFKPHRHTYTPSLARYTIPASPCKSSTFQCYEIAAIQDASAIALWISPDPLSPKLIRSIECTAR